MFKRLLLIGLVAASLAACDDDDDTDFVIANRSDFVLLEVHIAQINDPSWGPNLLPDVLFPGQDAVITDIDCDNYDVLVIDELGINCELANLRLCFDTAVWAIDNATLAGCAFTARSLPPDPSAEVSEPETRL